MTNWPSSCDGGVFFFLLEQETAIWGTEEKCRKEGMTLREIHKEKTMSETDKTAADLREKVGEETILKIAKEITVKFIEVGRVTPATFSMVFADIYQTIAKTVRGNHS
jgi:hypothetical protein